jgi:aryl-alcohol dehydrogenase-like predicted oxidoreductase
MEHTMNYIEHGINKEKLSQFCLGSMMMGSSMSKAESFRVLDNFIDQGGNFIDTANCYAWWVGTGQFVGDESENLIGEWLKARGNRHQIFLATKVGARLSGKPIDRNIDGSVDWSRFTSDYELLSEKVIQAAIEGSLRRLGTDHVDLYFTHVDDRETPQEETLEAMDRLVREGKVRYTGMSNVRTWRLERACQVAAAQGWTQPSFIQNQFTWLRPKFGAHLGVVCSVDEEMTDYLTNNPDITLMAYSPLLKGIYVSAARRLAYGDWNLFDTDDSRVRLEVLDSVAKELGVSWNTLILAWMLHLKSPRTVPILGMSRYEQYAENIEALSISLSVNQMDKLNQAGL